MSIEKLGNHINEYSVRNKLNEDIPIYSVTNSNGFCQNYFGKDVSSKDKRNYKIVPRNAFAYNPSRINVGSIDYQHYEERVIVSPLYSVFVVDEHILPNYLYYYLKNKNTVKHIKNLASGSVRDNLKFSVLCEFFISIPSIQTQKIIIKNLNICQNLINKQMKTLQRLDDLVKARFVEMFGDDEYIAKSWNEVLNIVNGRNQKAIENPDGKYLICGSGGIMGRADRYLIDGDSVIIGRKGNINKPILMRERYWNVDTAFGLVPDNTNINVEYLYYFCSQYNFEKLNKAVTIPSLTKKDLLKIQMPIPPIEKQQKFADFVHQVDKSKFVIQKSLEKTQMIFDSLMQEYFG